MTPTSRSTKLLREEGFLVGAVERWIPHADKRSDLYGFADLIAAHPRDGVILLVQTTTVGHLSDRLAKVQGRAEASIWLRSGGRIELHGWTDDGRLRRLELKSDDLQPTVLLQPKRRKPDRQRGLFDGQMS